MNSYIFFGGKAIGEYILTALLSANDLPKGIVVYRDTLNEELLKKCDALQIKIFRIQNFKKSIPEILIFIKSIDPDYFISVAFPFILPKEIISCVQFPINIHTGAIPKYRGHHPISAAFLNDEPYQGTTIHLMAEEVDAGPVLLQDFVEVCNEDTIITIREKLIQLSKELLFTVINQLRTGSLYSKTQIGEIVWAPKRVPEDSRISFNKNSRYLHNFIRSLVDPYPNAFSYIKGKQVKIKASVSSNTPGMVLHEVKPFEYLVSSKDGILWIKTDLALKVGDQFE